MVVLNKKGIFEGVAAFIVAAFGFALAMLFVFLIVSNFNTAIQANNVTLPNETLEMSAAYTSSYSAFDTGFAIFFVGSLVALVIFARKFPEKSGWFIVVGFLASLVFGLLGFIMENVWSGLDSNSTIASATSNWVFLSFFMDNFVFAVVLYTLVITIAAMTSDGGVSF